MIQRTCKVPSCPYPPPKKVTRGMCQAHYQRWRKGQPLTGTAMSVRRAECEHCGDVFQCTSPRQIYCSQYCKTWAGRLPRGQRYVCPTCGAPKLIGGTGVAESPRRCMDCSEHGLGGYKRGCRCAECVTAKADGMRTFFAVVRQEHGVSYATLWRRRFRAEHGYWPSCCGSQWIATADRLAIYERDSWVCQICSLPVDVGSGFNDNFAPSLDHIIPRSLGGSDDPVNLRTAHRVCNSIRGVGSPEEVVPHGRQEATPAR